MFIAAGHGLKGLEFGCVHALDAINEAMRVAIPSLERLADIVGLARSRRISRSDHIGPCLLHGPWGRVDAADGSEVFDLWRLRWYGLSLPESVEVTDEDLRSAVRSLQPLLDEVRPGSVYSGRPADSSAPGRGAARQSGCVQVSGATVALHDL
ncbi:hypothetical protein SPAR_30936 [Streptomyces sparsogenes DSM 40356]|uniref:Uncharacterized protein n=1 Tax=Streptomyces sparsogenes DSM 40356 TaxID=1331668 RepID=A0A1R1SB53_9ACTN|nr:hypothetical protein SPAR_30936 [Streptomyces sparsogenes DSM 40356]